MKEVFLLRDHVSITYSSRTEAIKHRLTNFPEGAFLVLFDKPGAEETEIMTENIPKPARVYFWKEPGEDKSIWSSQVERIVTELAKNGAKISIHLPFSPKAGEALIPLIEYGLKLAQDHSLLNGLKPLFEIEGPLPNEYSIHIMKAIKDGKADAICYENV
jgi:hypothetical protein